MHNAQSRYVPDTTVLLRAFVPDREWGEHAKCFLALLITGRISAVAPKNLTFEFYGGLTNAFRRRGKTAKDAERALQKFLALPIEYVDSEETLRRGAELSLTYQKSPYDMLFFAVAEAQRIAVCTADQRSVDGLPASFPCRHVLLKDFPGHL